LTSGEVKTAVLVIKDFYTFLNSTFIRSLYGLDSLLHIDSHLSITADLNYYKPLYSIEDRIKVEIEGETRTSSYTTPIIGVKVMK